MRASALTWRGDAWLAGGLAAATLALAVYFAPRGFQNGFVDIGHDGYQLRQVLDLVSGGVIFKDTFDQYGPLNGYLNAAGYLAFGRRLLATKYFICGWYALTASALFTIARHWLGRGLAAFSVLVWLGLAPFANHGIMISPHAYALLFQAAATLIVLRTPNLDPGRFALVGVLAGLSWAVKQALGVLYLAAIVCWLLIQASRSTYSRRRIAAALAAAAAGCCAVIAVFLAWLWTKGAIADWYLQTVVFPSRFYLANPGVSELTYLFGPIGSFVELQFSQAAYWIIIRAAVLVAAAFQVWRRRPDDGLLLMACITAFLWLGAYPSANFMHQWWTSSLAFPPFVACVRRLLERRTVPGRLAATAAAAVVTVVVAPGIAERARAGPSTARTLTETLRQPLVFRGIRTDVPTRRAFEAMYAAMDGFRVGHPHARVVSIESADGWGNGTVETLPLLSFLDDNAHIHPVYWNLPVLSTVVYDDYPERLWRYVREARPLIVDHRAGKYRPIGICGYTLLVSEKSDRGHWYVYAPEDRPPSQTRVVEARSDDWLEYGCSENGTAPELPRPAGGVAGAWRGVVAPPGGAEVNVQVARLPALELVDDALDGIGRPVNVYTWPADLPAARVPGSIEPISMDVVWRAGKDDIVRDFRPGAFSIDGEVKLPFGYLLQWDEQPLLSGLRLVVRGELFEGGLQIGFLQHGTWAASVPVTRAGPFEAVIAIQQNGNYALVVANSIQSPRSDRARARWLPPLFRGLTPPTFPNRAVVSSAGWIRSDDASESGAHRQTAAGLAHRSKRD